MGAVTLTLVSVAGVFLVLAAIGGAVLLLTGAWDSWNQVPEDVRRAHRRWSGPFGPVGVWICAWCLDKASDLTSKMDGVPFALFFGVLSGNVLVWGSALHLMWAIRILRNKANVPASLFRFARYAAGLCAAALAVGVALLCDSAGWL